MNDGLGAFGPIDEQPAGAVARPRRPRPLTFSQWRYLELSQCAGRCRRRAAEAMSSVAAEQHEKASRMYAAAADTFAPGRG